MSFRWSLNVWWTACCLSTSFCTCYECILASHLCLEQRRVWTKLLLFFLALSLRSFLWEGILAPSHECSKCFFSALWIVLTVYSHLPNMHSSSHPRCTALDKKKCLSNNKSFAIHGVFQGRTDSFEISVVLTVFLIVSSRILSCKWVKGSCLWEIQTLLKRYWYSVHQIL